MAKLKILFLVVFGCLFLTSQSALAGDAVYYLFRHAEKTREAEDPGLTPEGQQRVENLESFFYGIGVTRIFSSDTKRTRDTVAPIAELLGIEIELYDPLNLPEFAEKLKTMDGVILVSGHSNTTPELTSLLTGQDTDYMPETEYDRLYQVVRLGEEYKVTVFNQQGLDEIRSKAFWEDNTSRPPLLTVEFLEDIEAQIDFENDLMYSEDRKMFPLSSYVRYYKAVYIGEHIFLYGMYVKGSIYYSDEELETTPKIQIMKKNFPAGISDGGCLQVNFVMDLITGNLILLYCNGIA